MFVSLVHGFCGQGLPCLRIHTFSRVSLFAAAVLVQGSMNNNLSNSENAA